MVFSLVDLPPEVDDEEPVHRGQCGTIVEVLPGDRYIVEFVDDDGWTLAEPVMIGDQLAVAPPPPP